MPTRQNVCRLTIWSGGRQSRGELGGWLLYLCERTTHGLWLRAFRDSKDPLGEPLPMSRQQADAFMRLAREPAVLDPRNWERLPRGWTVVDAIVRGARRSRQPVQALLDYGTVHRNMTRSQAQALAGGAASPAGRRVNAEWNLNRAYSAFGAAVVRLLEAVRWLMSNRPYNCSQRSSQITSACVVSTPSTPRIVTGCWRCGRGWRRRPRALAPRTTAINSDGSTPSTGFWPARRRAGGHGAPDPIVRPALRASEGPLSRAGGAHSGCLGCRLTPR